MGLLATKNGKKIGLQVLEKLVEAVSQQKDLGSEIADLVASIDFSDRATVRPYLELYNGLVALGTQQQGIQQQYCHGNYRLLGKINKVLSFERVKALFQFSPKVYTEEQLVELKDRVVSTFNQHTASYTDILKALAIDIPDELAQAKTRAENDIITTGESLEEYNRQLCNSGYYVLSNGVTSKDKSWSEELLKAGYTEQYFIEEKYRLYKLLFNGWEYIKNQYKEKYGSKLPESEKESIMALVEKPNKLNRLDCLQNNERQELSKYLVDMVDELDVKALWVDDLEKEASAYDIFTGIKGDAETLKAVCPYLYEALASYIAVHYPTLSPDKEYTYKSLCEMGVDYYLKKKEVATTQPISLISYLDKENERELMAQLLTCGIITIKQPPTRTKGEDVDSYRESIEQVLERGNLLSYTDDDITECNFCINMLIEESINYQQSYNELVRILSKVWKCESLLNIATDMDSIKRDIDTYNKTLLYIYFWVRGTPAEKKQKREKLKQAFSLIELRTPHWSESVLNTIERSLKRAKDVHHDRLKNLSVFHTKLMESKR